MEVDTIIGIELDKLQASVDVLINRAVHLLKSVLHNQDGRPGIDSKAIFFDDVAATAGAALLL